MIARATDTHGQNAQMKRERGERSLSDHDAKEAAAAAAAATAAATAAAAAATAALTRRGLGWNGSHKRLRDNPGQHVRLAGWQPIPEDELSGGCPR